MRRRRQPEPVDDRSAGGGFHEQLLLDRARHTEPPLRHAKTANQHVNRHREDQRREHRSQRALSIGERLGRLRAEQPAGDAAGDEEAGQAANRPGRTRRSCQRWSGRRRSPRRATMPTALSIGMPVASISAGTIRNPPPMPKKPDSAPAASPSPISFGRFCRDSLTDGSPTVAAASQHQHADHHHQHREQREQSLPVHHLAESRAEECAGDYRAAESTSAQRHFTFPARA